MQAFIEFFISVISLLSIVVFFNALWDFLNCDADHEVLPPFFIFALGGTIWLCFLIFFPQMQIKETVYPLTDLVVQEYSNGIEYKTKNRELIYTIQNVEEYKNKDNITGFLQTEKKGWGIDGKKIQPIYKVEQSN